MVSEEIVYGEKICLGRVEILGGRQAVFIKGMNPAFRNDCAAMAMCNKLAIIGFDGF